MHPRVFTRRPARTLALVAGIVVGLAGCNATMPTLPTLGGSSGGSGNAAAASPGCESLPTMSNTKKVAIGAGVGALVGYGVGNATAGGNKGKSRTVGVLGGALVGALAGSAFKNDIDVEEQDDGSVRLKIPGQIMFASGQHSLNQNFQSTLTNVATTLKKYCGVTVRVEGHTDDVGADQANMVLSVNRARSVTGYLQAQGFDAARLTAEGRGETQPLVPNTSESNRAQNRRVEIYVRPPAG